MYFTCSPYIAMSRLYHALRDKDKTALGSQGKATDLSYGLDRCHLKKPCQISPGLRYQNTFNKTRQGIP